MSKFFGGVKIPEWWIYAAALAGKDRNSTGALHIGLEIWRQSNMKHQLEGIRLQVNLLEKAGFGRSYVRTALEVLENEGLIRVKRYRQKSPDITLITSKEKTYTVKPPPKVDNIIRVASNAQPLKRDRLGQWVSDAPD
jgi:hypothetical protein